jgi:uncharacterized membrane protein
VRFHHLALFLHLTGVVLWVGGMVFIRVCLVSPTLTAAQWAEALAHFFSLSWVAIALIVITGGFMLIAVGYARAPLGWLLMTFLGTIMIVVFASLWFGPWMALREALAKGGLAQAQAQAQARAAIQRINKHLDIVLVLAILTAVAATLGLAL